MEGKKSVKDLKEAVENALKQDQACFSLDGFDFYTKYAKYLLEYLAMKSIPDETVLRDIITKTW